LGTVSDQPGTADAAVRVSLQDVADRAGVSAATASRSLRGLAKVSPDTRQRVIEAARELSYTTPLPAAAEFAPGPRKTVAVIVPFITRWFFTTVTAAAVDHLREHGYDVLLYHLGSAAVRDDFFSRMPLAGRVDGILVLAAPLNEEHTIALRALDIPFVTVGTVVPGAPAVGIDAVAAARQAVNHLVHLRHRRIGLILGEADDPRFEFEASAERRRGAEEALRAAGLTLPDDLVAAGPHGLEGGAAAMTELLSRPVLPTAVFAEYDELAIGALWALRRAGLSVPGDISVISIDDHEMATMFDLTTVAQDVVGQGAVAAALLLQAVDTAEVNPPDRQLLLPTRLVLRGTTAPPATPPRDPAAPDRQRVRRSLS
jgi:LacI family transcriptional regulator, repressor for deo operon, udp, cdd, tsx, nupC, and nupG